MVERQPVLSVGMPVYNSAAFITEALDSILGQTFSNFELIITDNASDDGTSDICQAIARADSRVRYRRHAVNIGCPRNYNAAIEFARGAYFKWTSSNDICQPRFLETCVAALEANPDAVLACPKTLFFDRARGYVEEYEDDLVLDQEDPVERFRACDERIVYNNVMNGVIRTHDLLSTTLNWDYASSDMALMPELSLYGKFIEIPERLFHRRMNASAHYGLGTQELHRKYYPNDKYGSRLRGWRQLQQMAVGISQAPLTWRNRFRLYDYLARRTWWRRHDLGWFQSPKSQSV